MKVQQNGPMMDAEEIQVHLNDKQHIASILLANGKVTKADVEARGIQRLAAGSRISVMRGGRLRQCMARAVGEQGAPSAIS